MLKACQYCHGIHKIDEICPLKPKQEYFGKSKPTKLDMFRSSAAWQSKRDYINRRDLHLCRLCAIGYDNTQILYESHTEIHHIQPLKDAWEKRLDDDNLISLCRYHHELAERGQIPRAFLMSLTKSPPRDK